MTSAVAAGDVRRALGVREAGIQDANQARLKRFQRIEAELAILEAYVAELRMKVEKRP